MRYEHTTKQICNELSLNQTTVDYWRTTNKVSCRKIDNKFYFNLEEIKQFIENKKKSKELKGFYCEFCKSKTKYNSWSTFTKNHLNHHNMSSKEYYDKFLLTNRDEKYCKNCGKEKSFISPNNGYKKYCSSVKCRGNNSDIQEKIEKTKLNKYGDKHFTNTEKHKQTCLEKYGEENYTNREKALDTTINKYGTLNMFSVPEINKRREHTCLEKYGVKRFTNPQKISESHQKRYIDKLKKYCDNNNKKLIYYSPGNIKILCNNCEKESNLNIKFAYSRYVNEIDICINCNPLDNKISHSENLIKKILEENNIDYESNNRSLLNGKELDILIHDKKIAIEFNGIYWHSSLFKSRLYHFDKLKECENKGIRLIQIFEDSWINKKEIIKSMLLNILGKTKNKIPARKCIVKNVSKDEKEHFLIKNHIQGSCVSSNCIGLYFKDKLVSLMGFNKSRYKIYDYELVRFCNVLDTTVVGGASKLFKYFVSNNSVKNIVSYADRTWSNGGLYYTLGFNLLHNSAPSYFYVNSKDYSRHHRFYFNKKNINISDDITEEEYMYEKGFFKIYNCGNHVFLWGNI